jgi:hypothetical protein
MLNELKKLSTAELITTVSEHKNWSAQNQERLESRTTEKGQRRYLLGMWENWELGYDSRHHRPRTRRRLVFVQGGMCNGR